MFQLNIKCQLLEFNEVSAKGNLQVFQFYSFKSDKLNGVSAREKDVFCQGKE